MSDVIFLVTIAARSIANPTRTIVPPGAALGTIIENNIPRIMDSKPKTGDIMIVCLKDRAICKLVSAGSTKRADVSRMPTTGIETMTAIPARMASR